MLFDGRIATGVEITFPKERIHINSLIYGCDRNAGLNIMVHVDYCVPLIFSEIIFEGDV